MEQNSTNINWYPGHMAKTKREVSEKLSLIDIVLEVIDGRIPYSSKNKDIDTLIKNKPRILIITKTDLCDMEITNKWKSYYEDMGYKVVLVDLIHEAKIKEIINLINFMTKDLNEKRKKQGLKPRRIRALILGIPNVGKSTLINRLVGKKATKVGNRPGVTKQLEWIRINNDLELLDTPGILWPKLDDQDVAYNLASTTAIKEEILDNEEVCAYIVNMLEKYYLSNLLDRYKLTNTDNIYEDIAKRIGAIRNNEVDYDRVYNTIIRDFKEGYLGRITFDRLD